MSGDGEVDLRTISKLGVRLTGRLLAADGGALHFADDLPTTTTDADQALARLLRQVDVLADEVGAPEADGTDLLLAGDIAPGPPHAALGPGGIDAVVWATGYRRSYPWLHVPVLDGAGDIVQRDGVTAVPGLFTVGMRYQSSRRSTFIDGARFDARTVAEHIDRAAARRWAA